MRNDNPLNPLQVHLSARGITVKRMARDLGLGMHGVQKTVKCQRFGTATREAIARYLGLSPGRLWRRRSVNEKYLAGMTERAIMDAARADAEAKIRAFRAERRAA